MPFPRSFDRTQLDTSISATPASILQSDAVVVGLHTESASQILNDQDVLDVVAHRIRGAPLLLVYLESRRLVIKHVGGEKIESLDSMLTLERICRIDVAEVVRRPGAELPKHPGLHYEGPNRDHYEAFLRPGFGARSIEELDRLAFWLAPLLFGRKSLVVDHWSMLSIAYHVGAYLTELGDVGAPRVATLRDYDEDPDVLRRRLKSAFRPIDPQRGAVLVSVNSSGRLVRDKLLPIMEDVGFQNPIGIALTRTPSASEDRFQSLTTLSSDFARYAAKDCPACTQGTSTVIPIQRDSYLLSLAAYTQNSAITRSGTRASTDVMKRYGGLSAFWVHKTHKDGRHHAYFVDLEPILSHKDFEARLAERVQPWRACNIEVVLHPEHSAAAKLASMVATQIGARRILKSDESRLGKLTSEEIAALVGARRICLVDDVVISGARLFGYRKAIDAIRRKHDAETYDLYCLVGVARATDEKALMGMSDVCLHSRKEPRFRWVECLFLPNWDRSECRWCAELQLLSSLPPEIQERPVIRDRVQTLRDLEGLVDELFLPWTGEEQLRWTHEENAWPGDEPDFANRFWELGPKSVFGDVQDADLAVSVAAAIQGMRGERRQPDGTWKASELDEEFYSPVAKILDPRLYLAGRYYESVLVASILRGSKAHDIRAPGRDVKLLERIRILVSSEGSRGLHGELLLAARVHQLPRTGYKLSEAHPDMAPVVQEVFGCGQESE